MDISVEELRLYLLEWFFSRVNAFVQL